MFGWDEKTCIDMIPVSLARGAQTTSRLSIAGIVRSTTFWGSKLTYTGKVVPVAMYREGVRVQSKE